MIRKKNLFYFTASYPYGISEQWKKNELEIFNKYFEKITVLPFTYAGNKNARNLIENVEYKKPLMETDSKFKFGDLLALFPFSFNLVFINEFLNNKVFFSSAKIKNFLHYCRNASFLKKHIMMHQIFSLNNNPDTIFYFYWGIGSVNIIPFLDNLKAKVVCRFHGGDLYTERNLGSYIPFQRNLLKKVDLALPCSDYGNNYLIKKFPFAENKVITARLGTVSIGKNPFLEDGILKIVTCSNVIPVKRLNLLCAALSIINFPISWTHIGEGSLLAGIKEFAKVLPPNIKTNFMGFIPSENVLDYYINHPFDLFMNVSESEGVPVSIMEAFSASIPVYATDVGGTGEIVDDKVGKLLPADVKPKDLAAQLKEFYNKSAKEKLELRENAFLRYEEKCNAYNNAEKLAKIILNI